MVNYYTLLLRLEGPMQSWGYRSRFDYRDTALEPTRSGVIGLICAAMGIARGEPLCQFEAIRMGVRVDREGRPERDFHTAMDVVKADGKPGGTVVSYRDYLADAIFTIGLECSDRALLEDIDSALGNPTWPLFLGRKAFCLASHPLSASRPAIVQAPLREGLEGAAFSLRCRPRTGVLRYRLVMEAPDGERTQHDSPVCFGKRRFKPRSVTTRFASEGTRI